MSAALSPDEVAARLDSIQSGPWMERAARARSKLSAPAIKLLDTTGVSTIDLDNLSFGQREAKLVKELKTTFKWHGEGRIPTRAEQKDRDSFDNALTHLQMIELAIETGYLPADQIAHAVRPQFVSLLWPEPARHFVRIYDYTSVENLAMRLHIGGFRQWEPPAVDASGAVHFASFLATHRAIESNAAIDTWLAFLDDYVIRRGEQEDFYAFLESGELSRSERRLQLLLGAREFAVMLADFLSTLPDHMQSRFGGFYAYWLSKLFGYELRNGRYVRSATWGRGKASWAFALQAWHRHRAENDEDGTSAAGEAPLVERSLDVLAATWAHVRSPHSILKQDAQRHESLDPPEDLEQSVGSLTPREREVLSYIMKGAASKVITNDLELSEHTLKVYRARIMEKMGAHSIEHLRMKIKRKPQ